MARPSPLTRCARALEGSPLASVVEPDIAAHAVVALYLGLEMLAQLDGDRSAAIALFDRARRWPASCRRSASRRCRRLRRRRPNRDTDPGGNTMKGHEECSRPWLTVRGARRASPPTASTSSRAHSAIPARRSPRTRASGRRVRTLTGHPERARPGSVIDVRGLDFDDVIGLTASLEGATTLYNTYWIRFPHKQRGSPARRRQPAHLVPRGPPGRRRADRARIDHPSEHHVAVPLLSWEGRGGARPGRGGRAVRVLRPAILFGGDGVLLNNIAWLLRRAARLRRRRTGGLPHRAVHIDDLAAWPLPPGAA